MTAGRKFPALDHFRLAAALMVIAIHTSPLASFSPEADFWLTRVLARLAVPFFIMVTGYFLSRDQWKNTGAFLKKTALLYAAAILLYLPLNLMNGGYPLLEWLRRILFSGSFYHLWYFPALLLGVVIAKLLSRLGKGGALAVAALLYLIGLLGDSYYGAVSGLPVFHDFYEFIFSLFGYTRNGVFFAPLFLLLGSCCRSWKLKRPFTLFLCAFAGMSAEAFILHGLSWQRHDSMYLLLPFCMAGLFSFLLSCNYGRSPSARRVSLLMYLLHPLCIVLVRGGAKFLHLEEVFIENSLGHFAAVCLLSAAFSLALSKIDFHTGAATSRAWREIDGVALCANAALLRQAARCPLMAVVKADAYGHGAKAVARILQKNGVRFFAVACLSEGVALRKAGIRGTILVLGYTAPDAAHILRRWRLTQTVTCLSYARELSARQCSLRVHLALDTGMHRLGVDCHDLSAIAQIYRLPHLKIKGVFSHLCAADGVSADEKSYTEMQLRNFYGAVEAMRQNGIDPG
ncbi:MAG: alanine racemase, partial [Oscillospiraceae bacterium]|nr:alanine racemase [Oscillospiraceae bacterium]